jgi:ubiquinone/menaquinone biosynthesis C-methylase UbiE
MNLHARRKVQRDFTRLSAAYARFAATRPKRELRQFLAWLDIQPDEWVLDAACGPGTLAWDMAPHAAGVCGVDLCPQMIEAARGMASHSRRFLFLTVGDVEHLPFPRGRFDLTTCTYAFANLENPLRVVQELARVTSRRGRVAIADVVAPENTACSIYFNQLEALRSSVYTRIMKCSVFLKLFGQAGLSVEKWERHRRRRSFQEWLSLSPAATNPRRAQRLRQMLLDSAGAGLNPRRTEDDIIFYHTTAWFLLVHS